MARRVRTLSNTRADSIKRRTTSSKVNKIVKIVAKLKEQVINAQDRLEAIDVPEDLWELSEKIDTLIEKLYDVVDIIEDIEQYIEETF